MKKIFLLIVLSISAIGCSLSSPPNPGFRVTTQIEVRQGGPLFGADIPVNVSGTVTNGQFVRVLQNQQQITGTVENFTGKISNAAGFFDVPDGKTPATWLAQATSGWSYFGTNCNGLGTAFIAEAGQVITLKCAIVGGFDFPLLPSAVSNSSAFPNELKATIPNVSTEFGMPIVHFEDYNGTVVGATTATTVNGAEVRVNPSCIRGKPVGRYKAKVYNAVPSGTASGQPIGYSSVAVSDYPCPGMENEVSSCFNSGRRWDFTYCYCSQF